MMCVSLSPESNEEALVKMREAFTLSDVVELRIDGIRDVDLKRLLAGERKKVIVTNRCREEGGLFPGSEGERIALLTKAVELGADFIDVELQTSLELRRNIVAAIDDGKRKTRLILSWHDMSGTPSERVLRNKVDRGCGEGADIVKVVPYARTDADNLKILNLLVRSQKRGRDIVAFCMGPRGRLSRAMAPFWGSRISYVALSPGERTAPGQLTAEEMRQLHRILAGDDGDR
jgi:3-dehydroquinate dehydratase type I